MASTTRYLPVEWGPKYLKIRLVKNKNGVSKFYVVKSERSGLDGLYQTIPAEKKTRKEILAFAELRYSEWLSQLLKPKVVEEAEAKVERATVRFTAVSKKILTLTESLSDEYYRKVKYHLSRLNEWFSVECEFISDWNDNKWREYVSYRRAQNPTCQLNHDKRQLARILNYAYDEGYIQKKPKLKNLDSEQEHGRCLSDTEIAALYQNASPDLKDEIELGIRMAFRQIDIRHLTTARVDVEKMEVRFERGSRTAEGGQKNKKPLVLALNPVCAAMLKRRLAGIQGKYFFPSPVDPNKPMTSNKTAWYAACRRAGIKASFHDLRHTCATHMARAGIPEAFTQKYCRMSARIVREIYTHLEKEDSAKAANVLVRDFTTLESPVLAAT